MGERRVERGGENERIKSQPVTERNANMLITAEMRRRQAAACAAFNEYKMNKGLR